MNKAPLVVTDRNELGDARLNPEEALQKLKEENATLTEKLKIPGQTELENQAKAMGQALGYQEVIRRLRKLNRNLIIEDGGYPNAVAVRIPEVDGTTRYVSGFMKEILPEFSFVLVDEKGLPTKEVRGWRTVLLALLKQGLISMSGAAKLFGIAAGQRSDRWKQQLQGR